MIRARRLQAFAAFLVLATAVARFVAGCSTPTPPPPAPDASSVHVGALTLGVSDSGIAHYRGGLVQPVASAVDIRNALDFSPPAPTSAGYYTLLVDDAGDASWPALTTDLINQLPAAFSVSLAFASGSGVFEVGNTTSPTYNATPATNDSAVTGCTIADNQGHSASAISHANAINVDTPSGPHAYSLSSPGSVTVTVTETKIATATTKSGSATLSFSYRGGWHSVDSNAAASAITASGNNVTLSGGATATLSGSTLGANWVGTSFTENPSAQYIWMAYPHTAATPAFSAGGFTFPTTVVVSGYSFTNQFSVPGISIDIIRSTNLLNGSFTVTRTQ